MFVRKSEQLRPDVYPLQKLADCEIRYAHAQDIKPSSNQAKPSEDFFYQRSYWQVRTWLEDLPLLEDENVYVAREPEHTFVVHWDFFVKHWDAFYCDRFCMVNVVGDDIRWFLFFEMEQTVVWGCTVDYAHERDYMAETFAEQPIVYRHEFLQVAAQRKRNHREALSEYSAVQLAQLKE